MNTKTHYTNEYTCYKYKSVIMVVFLTVGICVNFMSGLLLNTRRNSISISNSENFTFCQFGGILAS